MNIKITGLAGALALAFAGHSYADPIQVKVSGEFTNYWTIGVGVTLDGVVSSDPTTWAPGAVSSFSISGTVTIDSGQVVAATLTSGPWEQTFSDRNQPGSLAVGSFSNLTYGFAGGSTLQQAPGSGASFIGSCEITAGPGDGNLAQSACQNYLDGIVAEQNSRFTNWNGIPDLYPVYNLFGPGSVFGPVFLGPEAGVFWGVGGTEVGDAILAQLFRSEPFLPQTFNSAFAGTLDLTVVPVPAAVWLFASALGLIGFIRRRAVA